jgi:hypothetical protein
MPADDGGPTSSEASGRPSDVTSAAPGSPGHYHAWRGVEFFFRDDHPWYRMACACGALREIRAWERYWQPGSAGE